MLALGTCLSAVLLRELVNASTFQLFGDYVARVHVGELVVALTFDDGPHPQHTAQVLDILDRHGVRATFFMMGRNVERYPAVARQVLERGHQIGNHSYSHPKLIWISPSAIREEIQRTDDLLRSLGVPGDIAFRPPHLTKFVLLPYVLQRMGKLSVLADVDAEEWRKRSAAVMTETILQEVKGGSIILMHDTAGVETLTTLEAVVMALQLRGYRFETVAQLVKRRTE
jgi:peptidoglycan/xylan/chitin deacetylase (PgdA/CDA1 family)